jgi:hypothetical protein
MTYQLERKLVVSRRPSAQYIAHQNISIQLDWKAQKHYIEHATASTVRDKEACLTSHI